MERFYYLFYSLLFLAALVVIVTLRRDLRRPALTMAGIGAILNPLSELLYFRDYWQPDSLFGRGRVSIEDVLFGASIYALALVIYPFLTGKRLQFTASRLTRSQYQQLGTMIGCLSLLTVICNLVLGINSVLATGVACLIVTGVMLTRRRDLIVPSLLSSLYMCIAICIGYAIGLDAIAPHLLQSWWLLYDKPLGITILGNVPLTELAWFFGISSFFSVAYLKVCTQAYVVSEASEARWRLARPAPRPVRDYVGGEQATD